MIIQKLSVGPIVGHASVDHVRIWGRGDYQKTHGQLRPCFVVARIREKHHHFREPILSPMNPNFDMSCVVIFDDLKPNTKYEYQMGYVFAETPPNQPQNTWDWQEASQGEVTTASDDRQAPRELIFGSCRYLLRLFNNYWYDNRGDKTFRSILQQIDNGHPIDKFLMIGDQIYADDLASVSPDHHIDAYLQRYRAAFSQPYIQQLMSRVSTYMTLDDHEIEDNWPQNTTHKEWITKYPAAIHAYQIYQASHSPLFSLKGRRLGSIKNEGYYYQFYDGCCDFFVTDTRTERELTKDTKKRKIISETQMEALLHWINDGSAMVKLIVSSVPFFPDYQELNEDKWSGFLTQRDRIIHSIYKADLRTVVFLSGDPHCSVAATLSVGTSTTPKTIYSIISSPFYWPYYHNHSKLFQLKGCLASLSNDAAYKLTDTRYVFGGDNFTRLRISPNHIEAKVYERKGELKDQACYLF